MKKFFASMLACSLMLSGATQVKGFSGIRPPKLAALAEETKVNPYVQVGLLHLGSNMNLPVAAQPPSPGVLQVGQIDLSLQDANFWTGTVGATVMVHELFSVFGSAGGCLNRQFVVSGTVPVVVDPQPVQPTVDFDASNLSMWYAQGGIGLGPVLLGLYGDHFAVQVANPRIGSVPLQNQTLRGDVITTTFAPYIGFAVPVSGGLLTALYSPIARSDMTLVLRTSVQNLAQAKYTWNNPGNLLLLTFEYNTRPQDIVSLGVWGNYSYMWLRGNADLEFEDSTRGVTTQKDVTATMTKYILAGGLMFGLNF